MEIVSRINWVDILVLILMVRMSFAALREGLSHEIFPFIGTIAIAVFSMFYYARIGSFLSQNLGNMPIQIANFFSFLVIIAVLGFLVKFLRAVLDNIVKVQWHPLIEKFGGIIVGMAKAYIITSLVLICLALMPLSYLQWSIRDKSLTGKYVLSAVPELYSRIAVFLPTIKAGEEPISKDTMIKNLMSDKSLSPKSDKKQKRNPADIPSQ